MCASYRSRPRDSRKLWIFSSASGNNFTLRLFRGYVYSWSVGSSGNSQLLRFYAEITTTYLIVTSALSAILFHEICYVDAFSFLSDRRWRNTGHKFPSSAAARNAQKFRERKYRVDLWARQLDIPPVDFRLVLTKLWTWWRHEEILVLTWIQELTIWVNRRVIQAYFVFRTVSLFLSPINPFCFQRYTKDWSSACGFRNVIMLWNLSQLVVLLNVTYAML